MTPRECLKAIDRALERGQAAQIRDMTIRLDWVYYRELIKLKGIEATVEQEREWEGQTGLTPGCTLPVQSVRRIPIHVNKPPEYSSVVRGNKAGTITAVVLRP